MGFENQPSKRAWQVKDGPVADVDTSGMSDDALLRTRAWDVATSPADLGYEVVPGWGALPDDWTLGQVAGVETDSHDRIYLFHRGSQQAYCKLQLTAYDAVTQAPLQRVTDLWGHAHYNNWWILGFGPILGDEDIYPEAPE